MNCSICSKLMDDYASNTLPEDMRSGFEAHLATCASCQQAAAEYQSVSSALAGSMMQTTGSLRMNPEEEEGVLRALGAEPSELPFEDMMKLFDTLSFREKWAKVRYGLKEPKESGAHKWAALQVRRLISPVSAVVVPMAALLLMAALAGMAPPPAQVVNVRIAEEDTIPELEEPIDIPEPEIQPPDPQDIVEPMDNFIPSTSKSEVGPDVDFSPQPAQFDSVAIIRSPVVMRGIFGSRSPGARGSALGRFGGGGHTEGAVLRALRWLKKYQEEDGSWNGRSGDGRGGTGRGPTTANTAYALLAFLAHGETPQQSPEFGKTVEGAIRWLVDNQSSNGRWDQRGKSGAYANSAATYALAEAYGMTKHPSIRPALEAGLDVLINGQNPAGGWDYGLVPTATRNDSSINSWCVQALKAAQIANVQRPGLERALENAIRGWKANFGHGSSDSYGGGFGYRGPGRAGAPLSGAGILSLQLLGEGESEEVRRALHSHNERRDFQFTQNYRRTYQQYYDTQARFHQGGEGWRTWNEMFSVPLVNAQTVIPNGIADMSGKMVDIGFWCNNNGEAGRVMDTCLNALQLMVYYRYLPTFQSPDQIIAAGGDGEQPEAAPRVVEAQDLDIDIQL